MAKKNTSMPRHSKLDVIGGLGCGVCQALRVGRQALCGNSNRRNVAAKNLFDPEDRQ